MHSSGVLSTSALLCTHYCHLLQSFSILWDRNCFPVEHQLFILFSPFPCKLPFYQYFLSLWIWLLSGPHINAVREFPGGPVVQFSSVAQSCLTLCDSMDFSTPGLPVYHQLPELPQTHVHGVSDAIQPSHLLSSPFPPASNLSQHQSLFKWVSSLHQVAKVLQFQLQHQSFLWIFRVDFLQDWLVWSPCSPSNSQESSPTPQFKSINSSALSFLHSPTLTSIHDHRKNHSFD